MKIAHIEAGKKLYGGARQVLYLLEGIQKQGIATFLICPEGSGIGQKAQDIGIKTYCIRMGGELDIIQSYKIYKILKKEQTDICHIHSRRGADIWGLLAAKAAGVPTVLTRRVDNKEPAWLVKRKYPLYNQIVAISEGIRGVLVKEGVPRERIALIHSAVTSGGEELRRCKREWFLQTFGSSGETLHIGVIAQLIRRKGHRYLLEIMPEILKKHKNIKLLLFGKGALRDELQGLVRELSLEEHVVFAGFREDIERILPCLDIVVHPAMMEGLGVSLLQASRAGVPIVAFRAGGVPEVVRDGENGLLVEPGDKNALLGAIEKLLGDKELRGRFGQKGVEIVQKEFCTERMIAENIDIYHSHVMI